MLNMTRVIANDTTPHTERLIHGLPDGIEKIYTRASHTGDYIVSVKASESLGSFVYAGVTYKIVAGNNNFVPKIKVTDKGHQAKIKEFVRTLIAYEKTKAENKRSNSSKPELKIIKNEQEHEQETGTKKDDTNPTIEDIINMAIEAGVIEQNGSWFDYKENKWHGEKKIKLGLESDPELLEEIKGKL